jgi:type II restriction/modification system DNA methylase subunit YeeA
MGKTNPTNITYLCNEKIHTYLYALFNYITNLVCYTYFRVPRITEIPKFYRNHRIFTEITLDITEIPIRFSEIPYRRKDITLF